MERNHSFSPRSQRFTHTAPSSSPVHGREKPGLIFILIAVACAMPFVAALISAGGQL